MDAVLMEELELENECSFNWELGLEKGAVLNGGWNWRMGANGGGAGERMQL